ncbi:hypothetical protein P59_176 [Bacillus phage P59]|nr:hypothetical protein P59_176 [Bacillus phage P59]
MPKKLVNSFMANRIYFANVNKDGTMSDRGRQDVTDDVVYAMFTHMKQMKDIKNRSKYYIEGVGMIQFTPEDEMSEEEFDKIRRQCGEKKEAEEN